MEYRIKQRQLHEKKEKLFDEGKTASWDLDPEDEKNYHKEEIKGNKALGMKLILSKVFHRIILRKQ